MNVITSAEDKRGAPEIKAGSSLRAMSTRVARGTIANIIRQVSNIGCQLALVPVLLAFWGPDLYGKWQMLTAGAAYVALLNFGVQTYATNRMNQHYSRADMRQFNEVFQSAFFFSLMIALGAVLLAWAVLFALPMADWVPALRGENRVIIGLLVTWHASSLLTGVMGGTYTAIGEYSRDMFCANIYFTSQMVATALIAVAGGKLRSAALAQLILLLMLFAFFWFDLARRHPEIQLGVKHRNVQLAASFLTPSLLFLAIQLSVLINIQGATLLVGAVLGTGVAAVYVGIRSLVNLIPQAINSVAQALWPEFTALEAIGQLDVLREMHRILTKFSVSLAICAGLFLHFAGPDIVRLWTHNRLQYDGRVMDALLLGQVVASWYFPSSIVLTSSNNHRVLAFCQCAALLGLALGYMYARQIGAAGIAFGLLTADLATSAWSVPKAACRVLRCGLSRIASDVLIPGAIVTSLLFVLLQILNFAIGAWPALLRVLTIGGVLLPIAIVSFFWGWLRQSERSRILIVLPNRRVPHSVTSEFMA